MGSNFPLLLRHCLFSPLTPYTEQPKYSLALGVIMRLRYVVLTIIMVLAWTFPIKAEPYSPSCGTALKRLHKAQETLTPYKGTMELTRTPEYGAFGELTMCMKSSVISQDHARRCQEKTWQVSEGTKEVLAAQVQYLQRRKAFEELFDQAQRQCLVER